MSWFTRFFKFVGDVVSWPITKVGQLVNTVIKAADDHPLVGIPLIVGAIAAIVAVGVYIDPAAIVNILQRGVKVVIVAVFCKGAADLRGENADLRDQNAGLREQTEDALRRENVVEDARNRALRELVGVRRENLVLLQIVNAQAAHHEDASHQANPAHVPGAMFYQPHAAAGDVPEHVPGMTFQPS